MNAIYILYLLAAICIICFCVFFYLDMKKEDRQILEDYNQNRRDCMWNEDVSMEND